MISPPHLLLEIRYMRDLPLKNHEGVRGGHLLDQFQGFLVEPLSLAKLQVAADMKLEESPK